MVALCFLIANKQLKEKFMDVEVVCQIATIQGEIISLLDLQIYLEQKVKKLTEQKRELEKQL